VIKIIESKILGIAMQRAGATQPNVLCVLKFARFETTNIHISTRNTLDCDQSNYSSRIVFSHVPIEFGQKGISAIRSADPENPILEPNTE